MAAYPHRLFTTAPVDLRIVFLCAAMRMDLQLIEEPESDLTWAYDFDRETKRCWFMVNIGNPDHYKDTLEALYSWMRCRWCGEGATIPDTRHDGVLLEDPCITKFFHLLGTYCREN